MMLLRQQDRRLACQGSSAYTQPVGYMCPEHRHHDSVTQYNILGTQPLRLLQRIHSTAPATFSREGSNTGHSLCSL